MSINRVVLTGRVGQDASVREVNGVKVANFSLATSTGGYTNKDGKEIPEVTQWHNCVAWRSNASFAETAVKKGVLVTVTGEINYRQFEKDGVKQNYTDIVVDNIVVFNGKPQTQPEQTTKVPF